MKKLTIILLCITTIGLVSCQKDNYVNSNNNITLLKTIQPNEWKLSADGYSYTASIVDGRIGKYEEDGTLVYITRNNQTFYEQIPFVYDTQSYSYTQTNGSISIDIQSSDFQNDAPIKPNSTTKVKIVIIESKF